jgi:hypothetical protein
VPVTPFNLSRAADRALCRAVGAVQRCGWREAVRTHGDINSVMISCGPPTGLKEIVEHTLLTVEGTIARADAALHEDDQREFVYTDYIIDVTRVLRWPAASSPARGAAMARTARKPGTSTT